MPEQVATVKKNIYQVTSGQKFGSKRRVILCLTENPLKLTEVRDHFSPYGVEVVQAPVGQLAPVYLKELLALGSEKVRILSAVRESTRLLQRGTQNLAEMSDLEALDHVSRVTVFTIGSEQELVTREFERRTEGYLDNSRRAPEGDCYDWDYRFVVKSLGKTFWELARAGAKVSSRDFALAEYAQEDLYYSERIDMRFSPQSLEQTVDFRTPVDRFLEEEPLFSSPTAQAYGLTSAFKRIEARGLFWRSAKNRMERNWWYVGLAGIPLTPKKDRIHEVTFFVHDLFHHMRDDPIIAGPLTAQEKRVYVALRMMSEAITLGLADMLFIDTLVKSGVDYDFSKRQIYPLFQALGFETGESGLGKESLRELLWMNARYCLLGDDAPYLKRLGPNVAALEAFKAKYMPFFVEDYRWTWHNVESMATSNFERQDWWDYVAPIAQQAGLELLTVHQEAIHLPGQGEALVEAAFERFFEDSVVPVLYGADSPATPGASRSRAFARYMIAQSSLFFKPKYEIPETPFFRDTLQQFLLRSLPQVSLEDIDNARTFYGEYVELLSARNCIQTDQVKTFKQVHPLFEPFYVFYDENSDFYEDLTQISERMLGAQDE